MTLPVKITLFVLGSLFFGGICFLLILASSELEQAKEAEAYKSQMQEKKQDRYEKCISTLKTLNAVRISYYRRSDTIPSIADLESRARIFSSCGYSVKAEYISCSILRVKVLTSGVFEGFYY